MAYTPVKTPVLLFCSFLSNSVFVSVVFIYCLTESFCSSLHKDNKSLFSGAIAIYETPKIVSGLVVKTVISLSFVVLKVINAP
jgi:hypothetical protein